MKTGKVVKSNYFSSVCCRNIFFSLLLQLMGKHFSSDFLEEEKSSKFTQSTSLFQEFLTEHDEDISSSPVVELKVENCFSFE